VWFMELSSFELIDKAGFTRADLSFDRDDHF
jgi:hypothetical protein